MRRRFLAALAGDHPTLPAGEFIAALEAEDLGFQVISKYGRLFTVEVDGDPLRAAVRCGMLKALAFECFTCPHEVDTIISMAKTVDQSSLPRSRGSFAVRIWRLEDGSPGEVELLEKMLGGVLSKSLGLKVKLEDPMLTFVGFIAGEVFALGLKLYVQPRRMFGARIPKNRPVVHPSTMDPRTARCMINLSRAKRSGVLLDPFCGVGGILLEAASIGCRTVGCDVNSRMVSGSVMNMKYYGFTPLGILVADAARLPILEADAIATDPPYGTAASTLKRGIRRILSEFLPEAARILSPGGHVALAAPKGAGLLEAAEDSGFKVREIHEVYIHRSLTREIASMKRG
ncbi:MAG: THUMP domain-containing protein [Candidatus Bathyarchaeia archaeon]